jgi:peptidyl-prolyl cis-trans isomerase A (cyclophilin A)
MKNIKIVFCLLGLLLAMVGAGCSKSCATNTKAPPAASEPPAANPSAASEPPPAHAPTEEKTMTIGNFELKPGEKLYATFQTSMGDMKVELFYRQAPNTVTNFVELATGKKEWTHPSTQEKSHKPLYDGTIFHRIIKGFMIQGGDPMGSGFGGPGYKFKDEFNPELRHSGKGILSMANSGPNTNGSQFFITDGPTPHLDNRHSVFGKVIDPASLEVLSKIASVPTDKQKGDKPITEVKLNKVTISKE